MHPTGEEIKRRRNELKLTQIELAQRASITRQYVADIEKGKAVNVSDDVMGRICESLNFLDKGAAAPPNVQIAQLQADYASNEHDLDELIRRAERLEGAILDRRSMVGGDLFYLLAKMLRRKGEYSKAYRYAYDAQTAYSLCSEIYSWCQATYEIASLDFTRSLYENSLEMYRRIEERLNEIDFVPDSFTVSLWSAMSIALSAVDELDEALSYTARVEANMDLLPVPDRLLVKAKGNYLRAMSMVKSKSFADALRYMILAHDQFAELDDTFSWVRMKNNIAQVYFDSGDYVRAADIAEVVLKDKKRLNFEWADQAETLLLIADIHFRTGEVDKAIALCHTLINEESTASTKAKAHRSLARSFLQAGDREKFNYHMTRGIAELRTSPLRRTLGFDLMEEYMLSNHMPDLLMSLK